MSSFDLVVLPLPSHLYLPLVDAKCRPLYNKIKPGDKVQPDQLLAHNNDTYLHAPCGGLIKAIVEHPFIFHKALSVPTIVLQTQAHLPAFKHTPGPLTDTILKQGIVGMGGAGFSTARKCAPMIHSVLLNAMECEPEITADETLLIHHSEKVIAGILALQQQYPAATFYFCTEDNKLSAIAAIKELLPASVLMKILPAHYPSGAERTLVKSILNIDLPVGTPASEQGILCVNIATVAAIADAMKGKPLTHRVVTVAHAMNGSSVNIMVPVGTAVIDVLDFLNIDTRDIRVSQGGSYMPTPIFDLHAPLHKTSTCILIQQSISPEIMPCIRCSACVPVCPEQLLPQQLYWHLKSNDSAGAAALNLEACIACGACNAACPSHIPLASLFSYGKERARLQMEEKTSRALSEKRYATRESRKARLAELREQKRMIKRESLSLDEKKLAIAAALARVQERMK